MQRNKTTTLTETHPSGRGVIKSGTSRRVLGIEVFWRKRATRVAALRQECHVYSAESHEVRHSVRSAMSPSTKHFTPHGVSASLASIYKHATPSGVEDSWQP